jgi:hypothetical protein
VNNFLAYLDAPRIFAMPELPAEQARELNERLASAAREVLLYLERALPLLHAMVIRLRTEGLEQESAQLVDLTEGLECLTRYAGSLEEATNLIGNTITDPFTVFRQRMPTLLTDINSAISARDPILLADIVEFELVDALEKMQIASQILEVRSHPH